MAVDMQCKVIRDRMMADASENFAARYCIVFGISHFENGFDK